ncbi:MAG TPA: hypothetical protein VLE96_02925 [Chlamydiales bacterium]|nr:hypothetical protein [Chlamydiales bacterium]
MSTAVTAEVESRYGMNSAQGPSTGYAGIDREESKPCFSSRSIKCVDDSQVVISAASFGTLIGLGIANGSYPLIASGFCCPGACFVCVFCNAAARTNDANDIGLIANANMISRCFRSCLTGTCCENGNEESDVDSLEKSSKWTLVNPSRSSLFRDHAAGQDMADENSFSSVQAVDDGDNAPSALPARE